MNVVYIKKFENGKYYIGVTNNFERRMKEHKKLSEKNIGFAVHKAMRKYTHKTEIVFKTKSYEDALEKEKELIKQYRNEGKILYNITDGGQGKEREKPKGKRKLSKEHIEKIRKANLGRKMTEENKKKLIKANTGIVRSKETREKVRQANLGKKQSEETKKKRSKKLKGNKNGLRTMDYYLERSWQRYRFKCICKKYNWDINDFIEQDNGETYTQPNGTIRKLYRYILKNSNES